MTEPTFHPTHRHRKGGEYELLGYGRHTETEEEVAVYRDVWGRVWVRPKAMFDDGRFSSLGEPGRITEGPGIGRTLSKEAARDIAEIEANGRHFR